MIPRPNSLNSKHLGDHCIHQKKSNHSSGSLPRLKLSTEIQFLTCRQDLGHSE